jgi:hypothetical protein
MSRAHGSLAPLGKQRMYDSSVFQAVSPFLPAWAVNRHRPIGKIARVPYGRVAVCSVTPSRTNLRVNPEVAPIFWTRISVDFSPGTHVTGDPAGIASLLRIPVSLDSRTFHARSRTPVPVRRKW